MSNYPPGVSGNEYAIAGPTSEIEETREVGPCARLDTYNVTRVLRSWAGYDITTRRIGRHSRVQAVLCTFEGGDVAGELIDHAWFNWACPVCAHLNSTDVEPPEPPEYEPWD